MSIPILDLSLASRDRPLLLSQLRNALFNVGFLYITNHGVPDSRISSLTSLIPPLFDLPQSSKERLSKIHSPHFLGYSGFAEEVTLGKKDEREQWDFGTELPTIEEERRDGDGRDYSKLYWNLRGPNLWPGEEEIPGFREALTKYHDALSQLSYDFVHLVEEAFGIPVGTFDVFFGTNFPSSPSSHTKTFLPPQHRVKIVKYPQSASESQGVGPHKDSSGWLTFLLQLPNSETCLDVLSPANKWIPVPPLQGSLVVNFGNAFEAATEGAVRATIHRVRAPTKGVRYSVPFFMGLPLDLKVSGIRGFIPEGVRGMRKERGWG